jgi:hypothetical protein
MSACAGQQVSLALGRESPLATSKTSFEPGRKGSGGSGKLDI